MGLGPQLQRECPGHLEQCDQGKGTTQAGMMSQENDSWMKWTLMEELTALRLQKLEQQRRLFEKRQRRKRQEPLMVRTNPDASLWHQRLQSEHFASDRVDDRYHQSEPQDVEDGYQQFRWGSACEMDGDRRRHGDMILCTDIDLEEENEESYCVGMNSQAVDNEAVPRALEGEVSRDVWSVASLLPLAPGPQPGEDLKEYMLRPPQEGQRVQCCIGRDQRGMEKGLFPVYYLYLEAANSWKRFLLAGRKRKWSKTSNYLISLDPRDLSRDGDNFVGKVRSNILGTRFVIFDDGLNPEEKNSHLDKTWIRQELGAVCYEPNFWGARGPRKMTVIIPEINSHNQRIRVQPETEEESILSRFQRGVRQGVVLLQNKPPVWSDESDAFVLNFHGRVTRASVKNFQIINPNKPDKVVLQFGRVAPDTFTMDFCFPLCPLQAFAICLSSFDGKLACV
ncbi:tubby-related protein 2 isoform X7 [Heterocephalus glaber]|uniref:Tubby-related protein 2 isoform X7 n=1 Tax=Heterocephalus glaber TaxID=10181 RepID=A0AAX6RYV8_HETGA|nr:tubby-related protein 2 isoform X7 [Heterocephalus glaber]